MKKWTKPAAMLLALTLVLAMFAGVSAPALAAGEDGYDPYDATTWMTGNEWERVDLVTVAGRNCYVFVPESNRVGNLLTLTPIMVVFGNEKYTKESALKTAEDCGFAEIARRDGVCVLFANPIESWDSEADAAAAADFYAGIYKLFSSLPTLEFENGTAVKTDAATGEETVVYPGSLHGLQFYGDGKGADYIAANFLKANLYDSNYASQVFTGLPGFPSGVALFNPSTLTVGEEGLVIPMAIVNGPANSSDVAVSYNKTAGVGKVINDKTVTGFTAELISKLNAEVVGKYYYSQGQLRESARYAENGIIEGNSIFTCSTGTEIEYFTYIPDDLDLSKADSVPMMLWFHGMGGEGEAMMSWSEWPLIGKENGFMILSVNHGFGRPTDAEVMEMVDAFLAEHAFVDETHMYCCGFSMGSMRTWSLALANWNRFAAIIPCAGGSMAAIDLEKLPRGAVLPVFYLAGAKSAMELGSSGMTQNALKATWKLNNIAEEYAYNAELGRWGVTPDTTDIIPYYDLCDGVFSAYAYQQELIVDGFKSADGNTYTWFALNVDKAHTITNNDAHIVWEYIKGFSRNADGTLAIDGVTVTKPITEAAEEPEAPAPVTRRPNRLLG